MLSICRGESVLRPRPGIDSRRAQIVASSRVTGPNACTLYIEQTQLITGIYAGDDPVAAFLPNPGVRGVPRRSGSRKDPGRWSDPWGADSRKAETQWTRRGR